MRVVAQAHASLRAAARRMLMRVLTLGVHAAPWDRRSAVGRGVGGVGGVGGVRRATCAWGGDDYGWMALMPY